MAANDQASVSLLNQVDKDHRPWLEEFLANDDPEVRRAFAQLVNANCNADTLVCFLAALSATANPRLYQFITQETFKKAICDIDRAAKRIRSVAKSQAVLLFDSGGDWVRLRADLLAYVERMGKVTSRVSKRNKVNVNSLYRKLAAYVETTSGAPHDSQVGTLADAASGRSVDNATAPRQRRVRARQAARWVPTKD